MCDITEILLQITSNEVWVGKQKNKVLSLKVNIFFLFFVT